MKETDFADLRALPLFAKLSPAAIETLLRSASLDEVPARALLMRVGEIPDTLCVLLDGLVQLLTPDDGDEATIMVLQPVTCFITAAVMRNEMLLMSARTVRPSRILRIEAQSVRDLFESDRSFARAITEDLCQNYRNAVRELKNMRMRTGFQRLIAWILAMQAQSETPAEISLPFDKALLAGRLGIAPETLSRDLARLVPMGVTVRGRKLRITRTDKLQQLLSADELCAPSLP